MALPQQQIEGKYEILQKLREGGMGTIYKVRHRLLGEVRVIKVMRAQLSENEDLKERFLNEARTAIQLKHPNIASLYDLSMDEDGRAYIVMEFIDGRTLYEVLQAGELPSLQLTLEIALQSLSALGYLHAKSFVHRDIAPDNVMLTRDGTGKPLVKLIDLGIAKMLEADSRTATGVFLGKIRYSAPEHFESDKGSGKVDHRCDLYSFGVLLYELLTGAFPIVGDNASALIAGHLFRPPRDFDETDPQNRVPPKLRQITLQALEKRREDRPASAKEFATAIEGVRKRLTEETDVTQDVDTTLRLSTMAVEKTVRMARPGSTQGRLDAQFQVGATQGREETGSSAEKITAAVQAIRQRIRGGDLDAAERELEEAEGLYGEVAPLKKLGKTLSQERQWQAERAAEIGVALTRIGELLAAGELEEADSELFRAEKVFQDPTRFKPLRQDLEEALRKRQERMAAELLSNAVRLYEEHELERTCEEVQKLLIVDPENSKAQELLRDSQKSLALERVEGHLEAGDLTAAQDVLADCAQSYPQDKAVNELKARLKERRKRAQAEANRMEAKELLETGLLHEALSKARGAMELDPQSTAAQELLLLVETSLERQAEEERRARATSQAVDEIEALLAQGKIEPGQQRLEAALRELGQSPALTDLRSRLEERVAKADALLSQAQDLVQKERYAKACRRLEDTLRLDPANSRAKELLGEARAGVERRAEEDQRSRASTTAIHEVETLLADGKLEQASTRLRGAVEELGEQGAFKHLGTRIETTVAEVEELLSDAGQLLQADRFHNARQKLERVQALDPNNSAAREMLEAVGTGLERQAEEERRAQEVDEATAKVESLLAEGKLGQASQQLEAAVERFGDSHTFRHITARMATMVTEVTELLAEARELVGKERFEQAGQRLERVFQLDRESQAGRELLVSVRDGVKSRGPGESSDAIPGPAFASSLETGEVAAVPQVLAAKRPPGAHPPVSGSRSGEAESAPSETAVLEAPRNRGLPSLAQTLSGLPLFSRWQTWSAVAASVTLVGGLTWWALRPTSDGVELVSDTTSAAVRAAEPPAIEPPGGEVDSGSSLGDPLTTEVQPGVEESTPAVASGLGQTPRRNPSPIEQPRARQVGTGPRPAPPTRLTPVVADDSTQADVAPQVRDDANQSQPGLRVPAPVETPPESGGPGEGAVGSGTAPASVGEVLATGDPSLVAEPAPSLPTQVVDRGQLIDPCPGADHPGCIAPRWVTRPQPVYPHAARRRKIEADITLQVLIDETGSVVDWRVVEGDRVGFGLKDAAVDAARKATYHPATVGDVPVRAWLRIVIRFRA